MPSWWRKSSSSKDAKKKENTQCFIGPIMTLHRKLKGSSEEKHNCSGSFRRRCRDTISEAGSQSRALSPLTSIQVSRCQSFADRPQAQPLPLPRVKLSDTGGSDSAVTASPKPGSGRGSKKLLYVPVSSSGRILSRKVHADADGDLITASVSSDSSTDSDNPSDSRLLSPMASDCEYGTRRTLNSPSRAMQKDQFPNVKQKNTKETLKPANLLFNNQIMSTSPRRGPSRTHLQNIQIPYSCAFSSGPDSSLSTPSRSPMRVFGSDQVLVSSFWPGKHYPDIASTRCSSPGSGHNSVGGDLSAQLSWQQTKCSPEYSPLPSPRMTSPGPSSRVTSPGPSSRVPSASVTPLHPRAGGPASPTGRSDDGKQKSHRLPLPPITTTRACSVSPAYSPATTPRVLCSPGRTENPKSPGSLWKKGRLLGRGTFGYVYLGFNSESGEMCAMKEVTLFADDTKSKECAQQLGQEIALLSRLRHQNIVQYYGAETVDDKIYIYLEYVSGGSIYKLLQEYGQFGEIVIRSYTQQILSGLSYLHTKNTLHRDIKGANILVDPNGRVKLADFGMAKHITGLSCPLSFKGSPYWMAPEVINNSSCYNFAVDIWSLGCTVLEMATTKPPWSQYEGVAAMFKIGNSKELPEIPGHLSEDGKDFVRLCLQRNPIHRPTAAQLLEHPFVKNVAPLERPIMSFKHCEGAPAMTNAARSQGFGHRRNNLHIDFEGLTIQHSRGSRNGSASRDVQTLRNVSSSLPPLGSPLLHPRSPQHISGRRSPSPISSPCFTSGASIPLTGCGAISFQSLKQPTTYLNEDLLMTQRSHESGICMNGSMQYHEPNSDLFRGIPQASHDIRDIVSSENVTHGEQFRKIVSGQQREFCDVQLVLADCASHHRLVDHMKLKPYMDLNLQ